MEPKEKKRERWGEKKQVEHGEVLSNAKDTAASSHACAKQWYEPSTRPKHPQNEGRGFGSLGRGVTDWCARTETSPSGHQRNQLRGAKPNLWERKFPFVSSTSSYFFDPLSLSLCASSPRLGERGGQFRFSFSVFLVFPLFSLLHALFGIVCGFLCESVQRCRRDIGKADRTGRK